MIGLWWGFGPVFIAMMIAVFLPGCLWVRSSVQSSLVALAVAPAFTLGLVSLASMVFASGSISWEPTKVLPLLGLSFILGGIRWFFIEAKRAGGGTLPALGSITSTMGPRTPLSLTQLGVRVSTWASIVLGFLLAALPMLLRANPNDPVQQWDSTYHLNGVHSILYNHDASPFTGLSDLYGGRQVFYPTAWHALVSLFASPRSVIQTANISTLILMFVWVTGAAAFVSVLTTSRTALIAAPVLAGVGLNMPADALTMYNQWPHATGLAVLPGLAAFLVVLGRRYIRFVTGERGSSLHLVALSVFAVVSLCGAVFAHPSSLFTLAAMLTPPVLYTLARLVRIHWSARQKIRAVCDALGIFLVLVIPLVLLTSDRIKAMGTYPRNGSDWATALSYMFIPRPPFAQTVGLAALTVVQFILLSVGLVVIFGVSSKLKDWLHGGAARLKTSNDEVKDFPHATQTTNPAAHLGVTHSEPSQAAPPDVSTPQVRTAQRNVGAVNDPGISDGALATWGTGRVERSRYEHLVWPVVSYFIFCMMTALAYSPNSPVRTFLLAPWYMDARRIMGAHGLMMVPIMALGFAALTQGLYDLLASFRVAQHAEEPVGAPKRWQINALVASVLLVMSFGGAVDARIWAVNYVYDANALGKPGMATAGELAMIRRMQLLIPGDALIVGDPIAGEAYAQVIGQHTTVFPQLTMANKDSYSQTVLAQQFNQIHTNPQVCEVVRTLGITHFYEDEDGYYYNFLRSSRSPGLYNVDTSRGFELVDTGGTAKLYKITACGDVQGGGHTY